MHETQCYEVGEVADEVKDEEKQIDVTGVEVALDERPPEPPLAAALPRQRRPCGARALDAEEPLLASVSRAWWADAALSRLSLWPEAAA